jgi:hypothetical protein
MKTRQRAAVSVSGSPYLASFTSNLTGIWPENETLSAVTAVALQIGARMTGSQQRDRWPSRSTFLVASIGAAVGLGNIWRFPYLTYKHGGGAFLIPYWIFMITLGHPVLQAELALGVP